MTLQFLDGVLSLALDTPDTRDVSVVSLTDLLISVRIHAKF